MTAGAVSVPVIFPLRAPQAGKPKTCVDTNTKIEIISDTKGAEIHYTLNGTKPEPNKPLGCGERYTTKYKQAIVLPPGRVNIRAVALSKDGVRESHVVSKTFEVEQVERDPSSLAGGDDENGFQEEIDGYTFDARKHAKSLMKKLLKSNEAWSSLKSDSNYRKPQAKSRYMDSYHNSASNRATQGGEAVDKLSDLHVEDVDPYSSKLRIEPPTDSSQHLRLQRQTDILKCIYCFSPRPHDPHARFCNVCGNPVNPLPHTGITTAPQPGQVGMCKFCRSVIPFNVSTCLVCEAPVPPQPHASILVEDHLVCAVCGTGNPSTLTNCISCESKLPIHAKPIYTGIAAPVMPNTAERLISCTKCKRVNNPDARYCDWCGAKPRHTLRNMVCSKCTSNNQPYAAFCATCGVKFEPPRRDDIRNPQPNGVQYFTADTFRNTGISINLEDTDITRPQWLPVSLPNHIYKLKVDTQTQTVGLFYPSQRDMVHQTNADEEKQEYEKLMRDRKPLMTSVSPGRGYWRKQMDHICAHLRAHATNDADFRSQIGEARMGKLLATDIEEESDELTLTINFALRGNNDPLTGKSLNISKSDLYRPNSSARNSRRYSLDSFRSESTVTSFTSGKKRSKKKKVPTATLR